MKEILIKTAREAGKLLLENFGNKKLSRMLIRKSKYDYSIHMDKIAEDMIIENLKKRKKASKKD